MSYEKECGCMIRLLDFPSDIVLMYKCRKSLVVISILNLDFIISLLD